MNEIQELQAFRAELDEPPPDALARARAWALGDVPDRRHGRVWLRRLAVPAVAAVVVAIVVSMTMVVDRDTAPPPIPATTAESIEWLARRAEAGPAAPKVRPDHLIQVKQRFLRQGKWTTESVFRLDPHGLLHVDQEEKWDRTRFLEFLAQRRQDQVRMEPGMHRPTPEWLAGLDPSPQSLRRLLEPELTCPLSDCRGAELDWQIWLNIVFLVRIADVLMPPRLRAGLIRVLGAIPGVTTHEVTVEGKLFWAIRWLNPGSVPADLYVDPVTGRIAGHGQGESSSPVPSVPSENRHHADTALWQNELITI